MMFDSIPEWLSRRTLKGLKLSDRYIAPPMPFSLSPDDASRLPVAFPASVPRTTGRSPRGGAL